MINSKSNGKVLVVVVTYQPDDNLAQNLEAIRLQVDCVIVVDNQSKNIATIESVTSKANCRLIKNSSNLGIAQALNQAASIATAEGFSWLATFDQDSFIAPHAINNLLTMYEHYANSEKIGILAMRHRDRATGRDYHHSLDILEESVDWRSLRSTITSGSLIRVDLFKQVGLFDDALFIDAVDHDFCLRIRKHGWYVIEDKNQVLEHSIGNATEHNLLGRRTFCTHHSPTRRYYMTRNQLEVWRRNFLFDPIWVGKGIFQFTAGSFAALLYEDDKLAKLRAMLTGVAHFALRRFGPKPP